MSLHTVVDIFMGMTHMASAHLELLLRVRRGVAHVVHLPGLYVSFVRLLPSFVFATLRLLLRRTTTSFLLSCTCYSRRR